MKEVIVEKLVRTTEIIKMSEEEAEIYVEQVKTEADKRAWSKRVKDVAKLDDVNVADVKVFINDISEKEAPVKKSRKKKEK